MTFHLTYEQIVFIFVWVAEFTPFGKELLTRLTLCSFCIIYICNLSYFLFWVLGLDLDSDCSRSWSLVTCYYFLEMSHFPPTVHSLQKISIGFKRIKRSFKITPDP